MQSSEISTADSGGRYTTTAIVLHWLVSVAVIGTIALAWWMLSIPKSPSGPRLAAFNLHKSIGITIFLVMLVRLAWRATHKPPPLPPMPNWQTRAARLSHLLLYVCLFIMPIAGFTASSFSGRPIVYFGYPLPVLAGKNDAVANIFYGIHFVTSWILRRVDHRAYPGSVQTPACRSRWALLADVAVANAGWAGGEIPF